MTAGVETAGWFYVSKKQEIDPTNQKHFHTEKLLLFVHVMGSVHILREWGAKATAELCPKHSGFFWDTLGVSYFGPCCSLTYTLFLLMLIEGSKLLCNPPLCTIVYPGSIPKL